MKEPGDMQSMKIETTLEQMQECYDWEEVFKYASGGNMQGQPPSVEAVPGDNVKTDPFGLTDVERILASANGYNDGADWIAVGKLKDGRFFSIAAGCDYTGWD